MENQSNGGKGMAVSSAGRFFAGSAKADITPDPKKIKVTLNGYGARNKKPALGILDPLYARALVISDGSGNMLGLVSVDLCYISRGIRDKVVEQLKQDGFNEHNLLLAATHTHSGYSGYDTRLIAQKVFGDFDPRLLDLVVSGISSALLSAKKNLRPARAELSQIDIDMNNCRRDPAFSIDTGGGPTGIKPNPEKYQADKKLSVIQFKGEDEKPIGLIFNYASHPTVLSPNNMLISADWPGVACKKLEDELGQSAVVLFLNGTLGDAAPKPHWETVDKEIDNRNRYGNDMADKVTEAMTHSTLMKRSIVDSYTARKEFSQIVLRQLWQIHLSKTLTKKLFIDRTDIPFQAARVSNVILMAVPGEPTAGVGKELGALCPIGFHCLVVAPANDYLSYFVTRDEYKEDGYASDSCYFGPGTSDQIKSGMRQAVNNLASLSTNEQAEISDQEP